MWFLAEEVKQAMVALAEMKKARKKKRAFWQFLLQAREQLKSVEKNTTL